MGNMRRLPDKANEKHRWVRYEIDVQDHPRTYFIHFGREDYQEILMHFGDGVRPQFNLRAAKKRLDDAVGMHRAWETLYGTTPKGEIANPIVRIFFNYQNAV